MLHLHQFDIRYNDTIINNENAFDETKGSNFIFDKIFRHFVFFCEVFPVPEIEVIVGYSHLLRQELNIANTIKGLNGFSKMWRTI